MDDLRWISVKEATALSGYTADHLRELIRDGKVDARKIVTVWQVNRMSLYNYLSRMERLGEKRGPKIEP